MPFSSYLQVQLYGRWISCDRPRLLRRIISAVDTNRTFPIKASIHNRYTVRSAPFYKRSLTLLLLTQAPLENDLKLAYIIVFFSFNIRKKKIEYVLGSVHIFSHLSYLLNDWDGIFIICIWFIYNLPHRRRKPIDTFRLSIFSHVKQRLFVNVIVRHWTPFVSLQIGWWSAHYIVTQP